MKDKEKTKKVESELKKPIYKVIGKEYVDRIYSVIVENKYLTFLSAFFLIVIFYFLSSISSLEKKIQLQVEIPPKIYQTGTIYIGYEKANGLFYKLWGEYVAREIGNYSPVNINKKLQKVIYLFSPQKIIKAKADFINFSKDVQKNLITNNFTPYRVSADNKGNVKVEGLSHKTVGANLLNQNYLCTYKLHFIIKDYHLFITSLINKCKLINKKEEAAYLKAIKKEKKAKGQK